MIIQLYTMLALSMAPASAEGVRPAQNHHNVAWHDVASKTILDDSLQWIVGSATHVDSAQTYPAQSHFITTLHTIDWVQAEGKTTYTFKVISVDGDWSDHLQQGVLTVRVRMDDLEGKLIFTRSDVAITIEMEFLYDGVNSMPYRFNVQQIQSL